MAKYENLVPVVQRLVEAPIEAIWDHHDSNTRYYELLIHPRGIEYSFEVYDRLDSPTEDLSKVASEARWIVIHGGSGNIITAASLEEVLVQAIVLGWLPGQPDPTL